MGDVASFQTSSSALVAKLEEVLTSQSLADVFGKLGAIKSAQAEWTMQFLAFRANPPEEVVAAAGPVKEKLKAIAEKIKSFSSASAAGGKRWKMPRKMSRAYCKKTPCRTMGFTQRSSCRPYKNCFTRRARRSG